MVGQASQQPAENMGPETRRNGVHSEGSTDWDEVHSNIDGRTPPPQYSYEDYPSPTVPMLIGGSAALITLTLVYTSAKDLSKCKENLRTHHGDPEQEQCGSKLWTLIAYLLVFVGLVIMAIRKVLKDLKTIGRMNREKEERWRLQDQKKRALRAEQEARDQALAQVQGAKPQTLHQTK
uniref:ARAD1D47520p n=1 Tax=Blastobotrys adeninivorans TaxID=409370 RepID=A0A060TDX7_BLAAD